MTLKQLENMVLNHEKALQNLSSKPINARAEGASVSANISNAKSDRNAEDIADISEVVEGLLTEVDA